MVLKINKIKNENILELVDILRQSIHSEVNKLKEKLMESEFTHMYTGDKNKPVYIEELVFLSKNIVLINHKGYEGGKKLSYSGTVDSNRGLGKYPILSDVLIREDIEFMLEKEKEINIPFINREKEEIVNDIINEVKHSLYSDLEYYIDIWSEVNTSQFGSPKRRNALFELDSTIKHICFKLSIDEERFLDKQLEIVQDQEK